MAEFDCKWALHRKHFLRITACKSMRSPLRRMVNGSLPVEKYKMIRIWDMQTLQAAHAVGS